VNLELSPEGQLRRDRILQLAILHARRRRCRWQAFRIGIVAVVLLGISMASLYVSRRPIDRSSPSIAPQPLPNVASNNGPQPKKLVVEWIKTDPTIVKRLAVAPAAPKWERINDDELSQELSKAGRPAGLAKIGNRVTLVFHRHD
jgi:hypothetical protein